MSEISQKGNIELIQIYMLMMSQNYTLSQAINNVELPNPYRLLRKLFKRHEREILGSRSIFKLLFEGIVQILLRR